MTWGSDPAYFRQSGSMGSANGWALMYTPSCVVFTPQIGRDPEKGVKVMIFGVAKSKNVIKRTHSEIRRRFQICNQI